jgi:hypothetical protein
MTRLQFRHGDVPLDVVEELGVHQPVLLVVGSHEEDLVTARDEAEVVPLLLEVALDQLVRAGQGGRLRVNSSLVYQTNRSVDPGTDCVARQKIGLILSAVVRQIHAVQRKFT